MQPAASKYVDNIESETEVHADQNVYLSDTQQYKIDKVLLNPAYDTATKKRMIR